MDQSIFSTYSQGENRVTASIIQVLKNLPINVVEHFLIMLTNDNFKQFFSFKNQVKGIKSILDAEISADFKLLFETKRYPNSIKLEQLEDHLKFASKEKKTILVYITPDHSMPRELENKNVVWKSFHDLDGLISELLAEPTLILSERDQFLLRNLQDFFSESELLPEVDEIVVVAASKAWPEYQKYGLYICQAERHFRQVQLMGFYSEGKVQKSIAKIDKCIDNFKLSAESLKDDTNLNDKLKIWLEDNPSAKNTQIQVFDLSEVESTDTISLNKPIVNDLKNAKGRGYAFTQGQRYVLLSQLQSANTTSDL